MQEKDIKRQLKNAEDNIGLIIVDQSPNVDELAKCEEEIRKVISLAQGLINMISMSKPQGQGKPIKAAIAFTLTPSAEPYAGKQGETALFSALHQAIIGSGDAAAEVQWLQRNVLEVVKA